MLIIGAGMSGLLAGQFFRSQEARILEKQESLPNNHNALLRFRSDSVSAVSGIEFKKVHVRKAVYSEGALHDKASILMMNKYSFKVNGRAAQRSINNLDPVDRYIAPRDLIKRLSCGLSIEYSVDAEQEILSAIKNKDIVISTMPVNTLANMLDYKEDFELSHKQITVLKADLGSDCDVYQTIYFPDDDTSVYRASITGSEAIVEFIDFDLTLKEASCQAYKALSTFGILKQPSWTVHHQQYGKLIEAEGNKVKKFISWATQNHNVYSLGRWGTHRQILMDDVVNDLHVINRMIRSGNYNR